MAVPIETVQIVPALASDPATVVLGAPPRGTIRRFRVVPIGGAPGGSVTYELYSSALAFVLDGSGVPTATRSANAELYRVTPDITVGSGGVDAGGFDLAHAYQNLDGAGPANRLSKLYMRIVGYGSLSVGVSLVVDTPTF